MSILDTVTEGKPTAPRITIYGKIGVGKSTFASKFADPLFVLTERNEILGINSLPVVNSFSEFWSNLVELSEIQGMPYKTIILDSISKLDSLIIDYILQEEPPGKNGKKPSSLNSACGGYGAGFCKAQRIHRAVKDKFDKFKDRGISVIFLAHSEIKKHKAPDAEDYDIFTVNMNHDKSREVYIDDVDCVAFFKQSSFIDTTESGRSLIRSTEERIMHVGMSEGHISKNRYQMPSELPLDFDEFISYIPFYNNHKGE